MSILGFCFDEAYATTDSLTVRIAPSNRSRPIFSNWIAMCCALAPEKMRVLSAEDPSIATERFVYPIELHWDMNEWCEKSPPDMQLAELPRHVHRAVDEGRAIVLVSFSHEGRQHFSPDLHGEALCIFDKLGMLGSHYGIPPEQLWFTTGNGLALDEEGEWRKRRGLSASPFTLRVCEISSFGSGLTARESYHRDAGLHCVNVPDRRSDTLACFPWQQTKIVRCRRPFPGLIDGTHDAPDPHWRFASLNRTFRPHRWWLVERLFREGLLPHGLVSCLRPSTRLLGQIDREPLPTDLVPLLELLPLSIEEIRATTSSRDLLRQNTYAVTTSPPAVLQDCSLELVTEATYAEGPLVTEKIFKALLGRGPAVVIGGYGSLDYLHRIGVATWSEVIDESYDEVGPVRDAFWSTERFDACMRAVLPILRDPNEPARIARACTRQREHNRRWLMEADKPWDRLIGELRQCLAQT